MFSCNCIEKVTANAMYCIRILLGEFVEENEVNLVFGWETADL